MMDEGGLLNSWEEIQEEITRQKRLHDDLLAKQNKLQKARPLREEMMESFRERSLKTINTLALDKVSHDMNMDSKKGKADSLRQEQTRLLEELKMMEVALNEQEKKNNEVQKAWNVFSVKPKREVVFRGATVDVPANPRPIFDMKALIKYPMEGGTALITFDEEIVAQKVLSLRHHKVTIDKECFISVEAHPIQLTVPTFVQTDTRVCPRRILVSNLPNMETEALLDKLELHFGKSDHGGGEVVSGDLQDDVGKAVLHFKHDNIAHSLIQTGQHLVHFDRKQKRHKVQVEPFITGTNTHLETKTLACWRTVLLTCIPAVMDTDNLLDVLEIFFQKGSNGGGEITSITYNPLGHTATALFE